MWKYKQDIAVDYENTKSRNSEIFVYCEYCEVMDLDMLIEYK